MNPEAQRDRDQLAPEALADWLGYWGGGRALGINEASAHCRYGARSDGGDA